MPLTNKWEPYNRYVQQGMVDGAYASGAFTLICAGPPRVFDNGALSNLLSNTLTYPIGMVQNVAISHNSQFNRVFEIGSERSYFIRGRTTGQISLGRVLYHGPSILRALYASYLDAQGRVKVNPINSDQFAASFFHPNKHDVKIQPGYENLYVNLASDLFNNPIGLLIKTMDSNEKTIGAVYAEGCYIPSHTLSTDSQGLMVQEQVAIQFERLIPVKTNMVKLIDGVDQAYEQSLETSPV